MSNHSLSTSSSQNEIKEKQEIVQKHRTSLPSVMYDRSKVSIWSILKQCVDKELYRFTIPIVWNEPLSLLQRLAENIRYSNRFLDAATILTDPIQRLIQVAAFIVSCTSLHKDRLSKPFNPLLGETYELTNVENEYRACCEQVSHHPPISAFYCESLKTTKKGLPIWKYYGSVNPHMKLNILNASVEAFPEGIQTIEFPEYDEVYTWHNNKVNAHNLILGKLWFEYSGLIEVINHKLNLKCVLDFKPYSWFSRSQLNRVEGYISDANENKKAMLYGKWDEFFYSTTEVSSSNSFYQIVEKLVQNNDSKSAKKSEKINLIWKYDLKEMKADLEYFNFTQFTYILNELQEEMKRNHAKEHNGKEISLGPLAPTDSRFRPDMSLYEHGKIDEASHEKNRLEEKQRHFHKLMEQNEREHWKPLWFEKKPHKICKNEETWTFNDKYWARDFKSCPDIY